MREPSTLDLAVITKELEFLKGFYIEKFYELSDGYFRFKLNKSGDAKHNLAIALCKFFGITTQITIQDSPTNFSIAVRKHISNSKISDISLLNDDRIIKISAVKGDDVKYIIAEMFGKGNLIIADSEMKIELAYMHHEFLDRKIAKGEIYKPPSNKIITLSNLFPETIKNAIGTKLEQGKGTAIRLISAEVNVGSLYLENALLSCDVEPNALSTSLKESEISAISKNLSIYSEVISSPSPRVYFKEGTAIDYSMCPIKKYSEFEVEEFKYGYEAMERYYLTQSEKQVPTESTKAKELEASIKKQKEIIENTSNDIGELKLKGKIIYENMQLINALVEYAKSKKRFTASDIENEFGIKVKNVDLKDKTITIEL